MPKTSSLIVDLEQIDHSLFFSNKITLMPDAQELGALISSYGNLLEAIRKVLFQIDPEFEGSFIAPELLLYEAKGSGTMDWIVKFCWGDKKKRDKWVKDLVKKNPPLKWIAAKKKGVGAVVLGLIVAAPYVKTLLPDSKKEEDPTPHLSGIQQQTINIGAAQFEMKPEDFKKILIKTLNDDPGLLRDISKVLRPARRDPDAHLLFDDDGELKLKPEAIAEIPPSFNLEIPPKTVEKADVEIMLRATDLDNKRRWAAIIPSLT